MFHSYFDFLSHYRSFLNMSEKSTKKIHLRIPFKTKEQSTLVSEVLSVDKELKGSEVNRKINIEEDGLLIVFEGVEYKKLRVTVNSFLKNVILIVKTINMFE